RRSRFGRRSRPMPTDRAARWWTTSSAGRSPPRPDRGRRASASDGHDDLALDLAGLDPPERVGGLVERVGPVDDRADRPGLEHVAEDLEVRDPSLGEEREQAPAAEPRQEERKDRAPGWREPVALRSSDDPQLAGGSE